MIHALILALGCTALCAYGVAVWALMRSWHRATGVRRHLARWLGSDLEHVAPRGWRASLAHWAQVAVAILVMPLAALALVAAILAVSLGMVLVALTVAAVCCCAVVLVRSAGQRTSAPGL